MTTEIATTATTEIVTATTTALAIADSQTEFTEAQIAGLKQLGIDDAPRGDLDVFFHTSKRLGLDPFQKQIYMIARRTKVGGYNGEAERWENKYTIQVGIDGFRVTGHRVARREGVGRPIAHRQFCGRDGIWRDVLIEDGPPVAARCVITCGGEVFAESVVKFAEYVQTTRNGDPTGQWRDKPMTMIGKCAEAAAWRSAFPQDFSQVYEPAEFHEVIDGEVEPVRVRSERSGGVAALREAAAAEKSDTVAHETAAAAATEAQAASGRLSAAARKKWIDRLGELWTAADVADGGDRGTIAASILDHPVDPNSDDDLKAVVTKLDEWKKAGETESQVREILNAAALAAANAEQSE